MKKCIICNEREAKTSEHKILRSLYHYFNPENIKRELINEYGEIKDIQGPKSKIIKFNKNLCYVCNGSSTQKSDNCFNNFIKEIHEGLNLNNNIKIRLNIEDKVNIYKYLCKILSCRIDMVGYEVPDKIINFILNENINIDELDNYIYFNICGAVDNSIYKLGRSAYVIENEYWFLEDYCIGFIRFDFAFYIGNKRNKKLEHFIK